jgi:starch-binding outer membrane protein, SusD/RagB family
MRNNVDTQTSRDTTMTNHPLSSKGPVRACHRLLVIVGALAVVGGCDTLDSLIGVDAPDRIEEGVLEDPTRAPLLLLSVQANFECALGSYVAAVGLYSGETMAMAGNVAQFEYDRRDIQPGGSLGGLYATGSCTALGIYSPLSQARWFADDFLRRLNDWTDAQVPDRSRMIYTAAAYSGFAHALLGEAFCSLAFDGGPEVSPEEALGRAEARFTTAIDGASAAGDATILNMARVGRARVRLNLGREADALADAVLVPDDFTYYATADDSDNRRRNRVFLTTNEQINLGVEPAFVGLEWDGVADPRVALTGGDLHPTSGLPFWSQSKYPTRQSPIPVASWREARLIEAEIQGGQEAVDIINELHARVGLSDFNSADESEIQAQVLEERRRELFLEGHRLNDVLRFGLTPEPPPGTPYHWGGSYGSINCLPLPDVETNNNPNVP